MAQIILSKKNKRGRQASSVHPKTSVIMISMNTNTLDQVFVDARPGNDISMCHMRLHSLFFRHRCTHLACHHKSLKNDFESKKPKRQNEPVERNPPSVPPLLRQGLVKMKGCENLQPLCFCRTWLILKGIPLCLRRKSFLPQVTTEKSAYLANREG